MPIQLPFNRITTRLILAWLFLLLLTLAYWLQLAKSHQNQMVEAELGTELRASQAAHSLGTQVHTLMMSIDFVLVHLIEHWHEHDEAVFRKLIRLAQESLFVNELNAVMVSDHEGNIIFDSGHRNKTEPAQLASIADRDYFRQHKHNPGQGFRISSPVFSHITGHWSVQFSHSIMQDGEFSGVILASIPVEFLADAFRQVYPNHQDVVLLALDSGEYITRTQRLESSLGRSVPLDRDFIQNPGKQSGRYRVTAPVDGVERFYAWHRIPDFPLVVSLGLGRDKALAPVMASIKASQKRNLLATLLMLAAGLWISRLVLIRMQQNRDILTAQERMATLLSRVPSGVLLENEQGRIVLANARLCQVLQLEGTPEQLTGMSHRHLLSKLKPELAELLELPGQSRGNPTIQEVSDGEGGYLEIEWIPIRHYRRFLGYAWFIQDISQQKQKEQELVAMANTDPLTGLYNRRVFTEQLLHQVKLATDPPGALLLLDIDHFKQVNDTYGHPAGDQVIRMVARLISESLRQNDTTGRIGGEEFAVLLPHVYPEQAMALAERIRTRIESASIVIGGSKIQVTISIGVAILHHGGDPKASHKRADEALYQAKNSGRNRVCLSRETGPEQTDTTGQAYSVT